MTLNTIGLDYIYGIVVGFKDVGYIGLLACYLGIESDWVFRSI